MKSRPEVVITGLGAVTPAGPDVERTWQSLVAGEKKVSTLEVRTGRWSRSYPVGRVEEFCAPRESSHLDRSVQFGLCAATEALQSGGLLNDPDRLPTTGCVFSLSKPAPEAFSNAVESYLYSGSLGQANFPTQIWPSACETQIAKAFGLIGPRMCLPAACATGAHAVIQAAALITQGRAERVLAGAAEASLTPLYLAAFAKMGALALDTDDPAGACKPFDRLRCGFVPAEGAAAVLLESAKSAENRGVRPLARIAGSWQGMHSLDVLKLEPDGQSLAEGIRRCLSRSHLTPEDLDYICAHGTGTVANDASETAAIKSALGPAAQTVSISSHKGAIGHLLGAAGALQTVLAVKSIAENLVPPTVNLENPDPTCDLDYTPCHAKHRKITDALCMTAGFGGQCGLIALTKPC